MEFFLISVLNGVTAGLLLFMLCSGMTLIFGMMGVLNFAHASFYMLGAYFAYQISTYVGFWPALFLAPIAAGVLGAMVEKFALRRLHKFGHVAELLFTFGLAFMIEEAVHLIWGRTAVDYLVPTELSGTLFTLFSTDFPVYRGFMMAISVGMLLALYLVLTKSRIGLIIQASLTHPEMVQALGHNVPRMFMLVFGGGTALAALAGVIGGNAFVTDPSMASTMGSVVFVIVVVGGMGSLTGAFLASLIIGLLQSFSVALDYSLNNALALIGVTPDGLGVISQLTSISIAQMTPILPYLLLVLMLIVRPKGLMGTREG